MQVINWKEILGQNDVFELFWINLRWKAYTNNIYETQAWRRGDREQQ